MTNIIYAVAIVGIIGLIFGLLLSFASVIFKVETDERETKIAEVLPGANCGGCGFAGCSAYAAAVVSGSAPVNACSVGKEAVAEKVAAIMGVKAEKSEPMTARVMCAGNCENAPEKYVYMGSEDCRSAMRLAGGQKVCPNGCLGFGSCVKVCKFDAVSVKDGIAVVDEEKCTACGACVKTCPKHIIELIPKKSKYYVQCKNTEKGALTNKSCKVGCIGCKKCEKACPSEAVKVTDNLAKIDYSKCIGCGRCAEECPRKIITVKCTAE